MYESFENLPEDRKKSITDVCIEEFAERGYINASTNSIVKKAGISKGILFHYFGSKKNLCLYMLDYVISNVMGRFYTLSVKPSSDIFKRLMEFGFIKLKMAYEFPLMYKMLFNIFVNTPDELKEEVQQRMNRLYSENLAKLYAGLDTSKFRKGVDMGKAIEIISIFLDGLEKKYMTVFKDMSADEVLSHMDKLTEQYTEYFEILKKGIYGDQEESQVLPY